MMTAGTADSAGASEGGVRLAPGVFVREDALRFEFEAASSGPGGQNVNKRATSCRLSVALADLPITSGARTRAATLGQRWLTTEGDAFVIVSNEHRTQARNKAACIERLAEVVARAIVVPKPRKKTKPSRGAIERRLRAKRELGEKKRRRQGGHDG